MNPFNQHDIDETIENRADRLDKFAMPPEPVFSAEYERRKTAVIGGHKKSRLRKAAAVAVIFTLLCMLVACTRPVREFLIQVYEEFTSYFSTGHAYQMDDLDITFGYLPEEYELFEEAVQDTLYTATYTKKGDDASVLRIMIDSSSGRQSNLNNEGVRQQEYAINENPCILSRDDTTNDVSLFYDSGLVTVEIININSTVTDDEFLRIIEELNITIKETER